MGTVPVAMNSDKDKKKGRSYWDYSSELTSYSFESWEGSYNDIELENKRWCERW